MPHFGDVAVWDDAKAMIGTAVEKFGDLHILVNNAGFCRDRMIFNMSEDEFDSVIRVHLKGHFCGMRFASALLARTAPRRPAARVYGRIINTSSEAFIFGSPGQPNYAAAKAGHRRDDDVGGAGAARSTASPPTRSCRARARA